MKLASFQVTKFRNIVNSGVIEVDDLVTCLVGKNEAGKSGILEALYLFNPAYDEKFDVEDQYPRWLKVQDRRNGNIEEHAPIKVNLLLESEDIQAISNVIGGGVVTEQTISIERAYTGNRTCYVKRDEKKAVSNLIEIFPAPLKGHLAGTETLEALREKLSKIEVGSEEGKPVAEDVSKAQATLKQRGLEKGSVWNAIWSVLSDRLPTFFFFSQYCTLIGRIDLNALARAGEDGPAKSAMQTAKALLALAGTDIDQLSNENYELRKGEIEAVQIDLTRQVFEYWKQNPHLNVLIDIDKQTVPAGNGEKAVARFLEIRLGDSRTGYSNNFNQRSTGFQWFFSFLAAFSEFEGKDSPIVLLDEPALSLHGRAQADFLRFINERLAPSSPVIYTTHSPFMVEVDKLNRVRIVEDNGPPTGAAVSSGILTSDPDSLFPLQAALGYDIAQSLFVGANNLVVEGTSDFIYLSIVSEICREAGRDSLDASWRLLPAGGATNIPTFVSLIGPHLDVTVVADSDTKGMQRVTSMIDAGLLPENRLIFAAKAAATSKADIEDLFSDGDYVKLYNKGLFHFCSAIRRGRCGIPAVLRAVAGSPATGPVPPGTPILREIERFRHRVPARGNPVASAVLIALPGASLLGRIAVALPLLITYLLSMP